MKTAPRAVIPISLKAIKDKCAKLDVNLLDQGAFGMVAWEDALLKLVHECGWKLWPHDFPKKRKS